MERKLIKLNKQHYIVVDDSEIKENQWYCNDKVLFLSDSKFDEGNNPNQNKNNKLVTHSTQPLEIIATKYKGSVAVEEIKGFDKIKPLPMSEVEEAIYMNRKQTVNLVNICMLIFGIFFMFIPNHEQILFLGIGFFVTSVLNLLFNNIEKRNNYEF